MATDDIPAQKPAPYNLASPYDVSVRPVSIWELKRRQDKDDARRFREKLKNRGPYDC